MTELGWCSLGRVEYGAARRLQTELAARRAQGEIDDILLLLEHPPIFTIGRHAPSPEIPVRTEVPLVRTDRGGDLTYHGPGQLVGYPVCGLRGRGVRRFVDAVERALCDVASALGVEAFSRAGLPGVWIDHDGDVRKLASIGLAVRRGVTLHGFALNVDRRAEAGFAGVAPCGLADVRATSLQSAGAEVPSEVGEIGPTVARALAARLRSPWRADPIDATQLRGAELR